MFLSAQSHRRRFLLLCLESRHRWFWKLLTFTLVPPKQNNRDNICVCTCIPVYNSCVCLSISLHMQHWCVFLHRPCVTHAWNDVIYILEYLEISQCCFSWIYIFKLISPQDRGTTQQQLGRPGFHPPNTALLAAYHWMLSPVRLRDSQVVYLSQNNLCLVVWQLHQMISSGTHNSFTLQTTPFYVF